MSHNIHIKAIKGGMAKDEVPAFLLKVGVFALQAQAGYMPQQAEFEDEPVTKSVLACDDSYEAEQVLTKIFKEHFEWWFEGQDGEWVEGDFTSDFITDMYLQLMDAQVKSPHRFMRDILEAEYNLPALRKHMTIEQKKLADLLEERFKQDETLRLEGKVKCHLTGVISVVNDAMLERRKQVSRLSQMEINKGLKVKVNEP